MDKMKELRGSFGANCCQVYFSPTPSPTPRAMASITMKMQHPHMSHRTSLAFASL